MTIEVFGNVKPGPVQK